MNWLKFGGAVFGVCVTVLAASSDVNATTIMANERAGFHERHTAHHAANRSASNAESGKAIDALVQIDATDMHYWLKKRHDRPSSAKRQEAAEAWTFTPTHSHKIINLGGLPHTANNDWLNTTTFNGVTSSGDWVLTATADYYHKAKRMIEMSLAGFFFAQVGASTSGGGNVPAPAPLMLILTGLAGIAATRRKA